MEPAGGHSSLHFTAAFAHGIAADGSHRDATLPPGGAAPPPLPPPQPKSVLDLPSVTAEITPILPRCTRSTVGSSGAGSVLGGPACGRATYPPHGLCCWGTCLPQKPTHFIELHRCRNLASQAQEPCCQTARRPLPALVSRTSELRRWGLDQIIPLGVDGAQGLGQIRMLKPKKGRWVH